MLTILLTAVLAASGAEVEETRTGTVVQALDMKHGSIIAELGRENETHIELFDLETGAKSTYAKSDLRRINRDLSDDYLAQTIGLAKLLQWKIAKVVLSSPPSGIVVKIDGSIIYTSLGEQSGVGAEDTLRVFRGETTLTHPVTGEVLGKQRRLISELEIVEVREKYSKARQRGNLEIALDVGDEVETTRFQNSIAIIPPVDLDGSNSRAGVELAEELTIALAKSNISVVERTLLNNAIKELGIQQTGLFDEAAAARIGKQVGAYAVLTGTLREKGRAANARLRLVEVETGKIIAAISCNVGKLTSEAVESSMTRTSRVRWKNTTYDYTMLCSGGTQWQELNNKTGKVTKSWDEVERTREYVVLYCERRKETIRLSSSQMLLQKNGKWQWAATGYWDK